MTAETTICPEGARVEDAMDYQFQGLRTTNSGTSRLCGLMVIGIAWCLGGTLFPSHAMAITATEAMKSSIEQVVRVLEDKELKKADRLMERRQHLQAIFNDRFSYEEMSKRSLGAHWQNLNDTQRQQFIELFQQLLARSYTGTIEGYSGERFQFLSEHNEGNYAEVGPNSSLAKATSR